MAGSDVLVWQKNPGDPVVHASDRCPTLSARSVVPDRAVQFAGRGTAGWLPERDALSIKNARKCQRCW
jgi:hypothetical protein